MVTQGMQYEPDDVFTHRRLKNALALPLCHLKSRLSLGHLSRFTPALRFTLHVLFLTYFFPLYLSFFCIYHLFGEVLASTYTSFRDVPLSNIKKQSLVAPASLLPYHSH